MYIVRVERGIEKWRVCVNKYYLNVLLNFMKKNPNYRRSRGWDVCQRFVKANNGQCFHKIQINNVTNNTWFFATPLQPTHLHMSAVITNIMHLRYTHTWRSILNMRIHIWIYLYLCAIQSKCNTNIMPKCLLALMSVCAMSFVCIQKIRKSQSKKKSSSSIAFMFARVYIVAEGGVLLKHLPANNERK